MYLGSPVQAGCKRCRAWIESIQGFIRLLYASSDSMSGVHEDHFSFVDCLCGRAKFPPKPDQEQMRLVKIASESIMLFRLLDMTAHYAGGNPRESLGFDIVFG